MYFFKSASLKLKMLVKKRYHQTFSALMIYESVAQDALILKNMSGALVCAHFLKDERRSRWRSRKTLALILRSRKVMRSFSALEKVRKYVHFCSIDLHNQKKYSKNHISFQNMAKNIAFFRTFYDFFEKLTFALIMRSS